ncbi:hypothetical protein CGRA01v4_04084 [Colletotrichum graminicola]|uniref:DUF1308 domain-containing protein n=1 Tax=Colletotrichum graminicola (strain M1.001 / M2 / FGSC 10212) TaxID=645133 RepID=E3QXL8_COLGM|nr:uncharacterized protein GLRG_10750 [Colletotrichum graminicola M1.001]EFQ35606.1 hypothetical protein GLRG_10750 [Colletotrichum graminicola M1.001]WDK12803.1 hypothetical protein CGRA01v4_04084 [Colletotrichum graminicola]
MAVFPQFGPDPDTTLLQQCQFIIKRITVILEELEQLKSAIERRPASGHKPLSWNQAVPGLGLFERLIVSEKKHLEKMVQSYNADANDQEDLEALDSKMRLRLDASNYKFYETVWEVTKRCSDLTGMRRELPYKTMQGKAVSAVIDLVANGAWIKVVTTTERRLCYEMADAGWDWDEDFTDEGADDAMLEILRDEEDDSIEVAKFARHMVAAARTSYQDYRRPRVHILMSRIREGENAAVDHLLRLVRKMGTDDVELVVETANNGPGDGGGGILTDPTPPLDEAIVNLVHTDYFKDFTATLNVDCSVFMALSSDFSHMAIDPGSALLRSKQHCIDATDEVENGPRLTKTLYPALAGRRLVCTQEAADTFFKIVYGIGTDSEQARTRIIFDHQGEDDKNDDGGDDARTPEAAEADRARRVAALQKLSAHPVPADLRLPIEIIGSVSWDDARSMVARGELPEVALAAGRKGSGLNAMNVSSFLYGWRAGLTTVTSNWEAAKRLKTVIETNRVTGTEVGPHIWRVPFSRKLLARPKASSGSGGDGGDGSRPRSGRLKSRQERRVEKDKSLQRWTDSEQTEGARPENAPDHN